MSEQTSAIGRESAPRAPSALRQWRIVGLLMLGVAVCHFNRISISVAGAERIIPNQGVDPTLMGIVYSSYLLCYTLFMTPGGWFIDRFGPRAAWMVLGFGSALFVGLTGVCGWMATSTAVLVGSLLLVRSLLGVVSVPAHPGSARMISHWVGLTGQCTCNGLTTAAACVGIASTYLVFGWLIDRLEWPGAFVASAGATALFALVWTALSSDYPAGASPYPVPEPDERATGPRLRESSEGIAVGGAFAAPGTERGTGGSGNQVDEDDPPAPPPPDVSGGRFVSLLRNRSLLMLTVSYAALGYFQYLFFYWSQYYFETVLGLGKDIGRRNAALLPLAMGVGMFAGGWLADRATARVGSSRGSAFVAAAGLFLAAVVLGAGLLSRDATLALACFAVSMACAGASEGPFWTTAVALGGRRGGASAAILNTGGNAGGLLAPVVTPLFSHYLGWEGGIGLACVMGVLGAVLWYGVDPTERGDEA
jgi:MFS family permease